MKTHSPQHYSPNKNTWGELGKMNPQSTHFGLVSNLQIVGLEQIQNNILAEEYLHSQIEIEKFGYLFKNEQAYPQGPEYDRICPLCSQFVLDGSYYLIYSSKQLKRKFLSHYQCLLTQGAQRFRFIDVPQQIDEAILRHQTQQTKRKRSTEMSSGYYATLTMSHPISDAVYLQLDRKVKGWNNQELEWTFGCAQPSLYSPNFVCIPYTDFKFSLTVDYKKMIKKYEFLVNLNRRQSKKKSSVQASTSSITFDMDILNSPEEKDAIVSQMNYIYPFTKNFMLIKLNHIKIKIPQQLEQMQISTAEKKITSESTPSPSFFSPTVQNQNDYLYSSNQEHSYYNCAIPQPTRVPEYMIQHSPVHANQQPLECYYNDIDDIIASKRIKEFVETSNGSREFQKYLKKCTYQEVEQVLNSSYDDLPQFIVHDYANYMFQGLVHACSPEQRIRVVNKIAPSLPVLVQNKKGTHSLQTLITLITTAQQSHIICKALEKDFIALSQNPNATHFIQKIVQAFDIIYLTDCFGQLIKEFIRLCKNPFGICVLKAFMKKIQNNEQMVTAVVNSVRENLDVIIQDPYGNYIVQYAYQMFGEVMCKKVTEEIINKFTQYCIQKFSANVVEKCVLAYCNNIHEKAISSIIQANSLEQILKTPTGNSILLKLVVESPNKEIEEKIRKILSLPRMSKYSNNWDSHFYYANQKSATCKNVNGEAFNNFSEAAEMARTGKPKKGSYTPKTKKF